MYILYLRLITSHVFYILYILYIGIYVCVYINVKYLTNYLKIILKNSLQMYYKLWSFGWCFVLNIHCRFWNSHATNEIVYHSCLFIFQSCLPLRHLNLSRTLNVESSYMWLIINTKTEILVTGIVSHHSKEGRKNNAVALQVKPWLFQNTIKFLIYIYIFLAL